MPHIFRSPLAVPSLLALMVTACNAPAPPTPSAANPASVESAFTDDAGQGNGYVLHIRYPQLQPEWNTLAQALHAFAAVQKKDFLSARAADENTNAPGYSLDLEFNVARRTADFVSVLSNGSVYTGGAHGNPVLVSFNLHPADGKLVAIEDLFANAPAALKALSDESRRQLEGRYDAATHDAMTEKQRATDRQQMYAWIEHGTEPKADNFKVFLVDGLDTRAIGLTLIFPPYQVASYADGPQQLEVPAKVFYAFLKPEYHDSFAIDTEAEKLAPGVR